MQHVYRCQQWYILHALGYTYFGKVHEEDASKGVYDADTNILLQVFKEQFVRLNPEHKGEVEQVLRDIRKELDDDDWGVVSIDA